MAITLQQMRDHIREYLDLDAEELSDAVLDVFIREGARKVVDKELHWPFYESQWSFSTTANEPYYALSVVAPNLNEIAQVRVGGDVVSWVGHGQAEVDYVDATGGDPLGWSVWGDRFYLWPVPQSVLAVDVRGYRKPVDFVALGSGQSPDMPEDFHNLVLSWALLRTYAHQDDPEMAAMFKAQFDEEIMTLWRSHMRGPASQPLVLNGGRRPQLLKGYRWTGYAS